MSFSAPAVYRRGYSLLLLLQITACLADLKIAIKPPIPPPFVFGATIAQRKHPVSLPAEVAVAPFTFPFPSTAAVVVTEALSGVSASLPIAENVVMLYPKSGTQTASEFWAQIFEPSPTCCVCSKIGRVSRKTRKIFGHKDRKQPAQPLPDLLPIHPNTYTH